MWQSFKNQKSELTVLLDFPLASSWCTPIFLYTLFSWRNLQNKMTTFQLFRQFSKKTKKSILNGEFPPLESAPIFLLEPIITACPRGSFWTPQLSSGTHDGDFYQWFVLEELKKLSVYWTSVISLLKSYQFSELCHFKDWSQISH